jgi:hypothetical protein
VNGLMTKNHCNVLVMQYEFSGQLLCDSKIVTSRHCQIWTQEFCGAVVLYGDEEQRLVLCSCITKW